MALTVPVGDLQHTALNGNVTAITNEISSIGTANGALVAKLTADKAQAQMNLVLSLLGAGKLTASSVLSTCTYGS
ncbi:MAG TPA: hypothetical protein VHY36_11155 [Steroidobacteraceae bacterium]|jgi:hypothetical protein|nr:hypothetical protein [Steroidobacteraceae bacterium]